MSECSVSVRMTDRIDCWLSLLLFELAEILVQLAKLMLWEYFIQPSWLVFEPGYRNTETRNG